MQEDATPGDKYAYGAARAGDYTTISVPGHMVARLVVFAATGAAADGNIHHGAEASDAAAVDEYAWQTDCLMDRLYPERGDEDT